MKREEFMRELERLLRNASEDERSEALQYYNDYFDDAGPEREAEIIEELGSPAQVAKVIWAGFGDAESDRGEFRETGYADPRFEKKEAPARRAAGEDSQQKSSGYNYGSDTSYSYRKYQDTGSAYRKSESGSAYRREYDDSRYRTQYRSGKEPMGIGMKILLILGILFIGIPVVLPLALTFIILAFTFVLVIGILAVSFLFVFIALAISGVIIIGAGVANMFVEAVAGLMMLGVGMLLTAIGAAGTVAMAKAVVVIVPGVFRGTVELIRRPFQRKAV